MSFNKYDMDEYEYKIYDEKFPGEGMTCEERDYYLSILEMCKDICDSENKINDIGKCEILRARLIKENDSVKVDGYLYIGEPGKGEGRYLNAEMFFKPDSVVVAMKITRLGGKGQNKEYNVLDHFSLENRKINRRSVYNYDTMKYFNDTVVNQEMKGKLR